jgi:hypothetical protein
MPVVVLRRRGVPQLDYINTQAGASASPEEDTK